MAIQIQQINEAEIHVNNKPVVLDINGNWIAKVELTQNETTAFFQHIKSNARTD